MSQQSSSATTGLLYLENHLFLKGKFRMDFEIKLQDFATDIQSAKIIRVHKNAGENICADTSLFDVEANKSSISIKPGIAGHIKSINVAEGDTIEADSVLAVVTGQKTSVQTPATPDTNMKPQTTGKSFDYFATLLERAQQKFESDITIIGAGPGGYVAAIYAAKLGTKVILIEKAKVGGTCLNWGCIPTKALVRSAEVYTILRNAKDYGCNNKDVTVDMKQVIHRKDKIVSELVEGIHYLLKKNGVTLVTGEAELLDEEQVIVRSSSVETTIKSKHIIIATGSQPSTLSIPGIDLPNILDSTAILALDRLPDKLVIIGGGIIGMEFAFIFNSFGVNVSVLEYLDKILANCDTDICNEIAQSAQNKGIALYRNSKVERILKAEGEECVVCFTRDNKVRYITAEKVLLAVGREPYLKGLNAEKLGLELETHGGIRVNDKMETNIPNIYAIGDVTNKINLAHVASHQGIVAVDNILGHNNKMDYSAVPNAIFTDPEIATVGVTERLAEKEGIDIQVGKFPFAANGKALTLGEPNGFIKLIKHAQTGKIIGAGIIGANSTDLVAELTLAVRNGLTVRQITRTIHAHPTTAEVIHEAALATEGGAIHFAD
jgi:dihydrolipoamide dehydrogenase